MKLRLRSVAEADAAEAIRWYGDIDPNLASRFLEAFSSTLDNIQHNPHLDHGRSGEAP